MAGFYRVFNWVFTGFYRLLVPFSFPKILPGFLDDFSSFFFFLCSLERTELFLFESGFLRVSLCLFFRLIGGLLTGFRQREPARWTVVDLATGHRRRSIAGLLPVPAEPDGGLFNIRIVSHSSGSSPIFLFFFLAKKQNKTRVTANQHAGCVLAVRPVRSIVLEADVFDFLACLFVLERCASFLSECSFVSPGFTEFFALSRVFLSSTGFF